MIKIKEPENKNYKRLVNFGSLYGILLLLLTGLVFLNSEFFVIRTVEVVGNQEVSAEDIIRIAKLNMYKNIFQINLLAIKEAILKNPKIAAVEVTCRLPNKIIIKVRERHALCLLLYADNLLLIGEDAVVIGIKEENEPIKLPIVSGIELTKIEFGDVVDNTKFKNALEILRYADEELYQALSEINLKNYQLYIDLPSSHHTIEVELGDESQIEKKMYNLRAILSNTVPRELSKIDLRAPDFPTYFH